MATEASTKNNDNSNHDVEVMESGQQSTAPSMKTSLIEPWYWKFGPLLAFVGMLCAVIIPVAVVLSADDNCNRERYTVSFEVNETSNVQRIQLTNLSNVYPGMISTQHFVVDDGREVTSRSYYASIGQGGWFDKALSLGPTIGNGMSVTAYHHNQMEVETFVKSVLPNIDIASPIVCDPPTESVKLSRVTIGGESEVFPLGTCHIVRLDEPSLEPREFDITYTGRVLVDRYREDDFP